MQKIIKAIRPIIRTNSSVSVVPPNLSAVADHSASTKASPLTQDYDAPTDPMGVQFATREGYSRRGISVGLAPSPTRCGRLSALLGSVIVFINLNIVSRVCQMFFED